MKYKCLVFDHDDTVVNSTATIHHPCFQAFLDRYYPGQTCSLEDYFRLNFDPGFVPMCKEIYGMDDRMLEVETEFWREYVKTRVPRAYPGLREIMERQKAAGGLVCAVSHSFADNIRRDWALNGLPEPDAVFGWEQPPERRKPKPWPLEELMRRFALEPSDMLMIDDLKPGYDMAADCGVDFAAVGWSSDVPEIAEFLRRSCPRYFKTVEALAAFLED